AARADASDFLKDSRRATVALSRAQSGLIIIADFEAIREGETWRRFITMAKQHTPFVDERYLEVMECEEPTRDSNGVLNDLKGRLLSLNFLGKNYLNKQMFIYLIIFLLLPTTPTTNALPNLLTKANPFPNLYKGICNVYSTMNLIDNPLNGSTEIILENYFKEFLLTEDSNQINKIYLQISILSQVFLTEIAMDRVESGANIGLIARLTMLCPFNFTLPYEIRLCDIVATYKSEYKKLVEKNFEKSTQKYSPIDCVSFSDNKNNQVNERMEMIFGSLRFFILHEMLPEYFGQLEKISVRNYLIKLSDDSLATEIKLFEDKTLIKMFYDSLKTKNKLSVDSRRNKAKFKLIKTKYQQWRILHVLDYFLYKGWYKINIENKVGIEQIKNIWKTIFENYWNGNNFLKEFVLNFNESEEEEIEEELDQIFLDPNIYSETNFDVHLKYLFVMKECTENILNDKNITINEDITIKNITIKENKEENKKYLKNCVNEEIKKLDKNIEEMDKFKGNIQKLKFIEKIYTDKVYNPIIIVN
uniref:Uncharacterized protein n=1 Tax=Meloidogyne floridensis TaxID=298350 RepID=A0A915NMM1_9BILA